MESASGPPADLSAAAARLFGYRLPLAVRYAELLAGDGVVRGLIGPRETPRLWDRHLLNCAAMAELVPSGASVIDIGSGAGLPGIVLSVARPDLQVTLIESLARRTSFLEEAVAALGLATVTVVRARAEECVGRLAPADVVTARAVAPLDRLTSWCLPLVVPGGRMLAIKGSAAGDEAIEHQTAVRRLGGSVPVLRRCADGLLDPPTTVIEIRRMVDQPGGRAGRPGAGRGRPHGGQGPDR